MVHLTCYDYFCHLHGRNPDKLAPAFASLDENLGLLLEAAGEDTSVIVFSDHAQLCVHTVLTPNDMLVSMGMLGAADGGYAPGSSGCFFECCGGSAFFHPGALDTADTGRVRAAAESSEGFSRFLTLDEMNGCGRGDLPFGYAAKPGYSLESVKTDIKGDHGYPLDTPDYTVFYAVSGKGFTPGISHGGSLLDIAPLAARVLDIVM